MKSVQRLTLRDIEREMFDLYELSASQLLGRMHAVLSALRNFPPHKYWLRHSHDTDADRARVYGESSTADLTGSGVATVEHLRATPRVSASQFELQAVPNAVLQRLYLKTIKQTTKTTVAAAAKRRPPIGANTK